jgi:hypothetical protein
MALVQLWFAQQILTRNAPLVTHFSGQPVHDVFKFADISRPRVAFQMGQNVGGNVVGYLRAIPLLIFAKEVLGQGQDVVATIT